MRRSVKNKILFSNALMTAVTVVLLLLINLFMVKVYWELIEKKWENLILSVGGVGTVEKLIEEWTVHQQSFLWLLLLDAIICILVYMIVCAVFTEKLSKHIMQPLDMLCDAAERIQNNDFTKPVYYKGEVEFESICDNFNNMQKHILDEKERNCKYEKARRDMINGISHDLKTPLTAIKGAIKGLIDEIIKEPEQQKKFLNMAYRRTGDMEMLLGQLLYVSKLETGNLPLHFQHINVSDFIKRYMKEKEYAFGVEIYAKFIDEAEIDVDPEQLHRIFDNLIDNSEKYSETEKLRISISVLQTEDTYIIRFADNGVGIEEEKIKFVFDEFYRGDESRNEKNGNGLGLYIIKCLTELMGGSVWAKNEGGFAVYIEFKKG